MPISLQGSCLGIERVLQSHRIEGFGELGGFFAYSAALAMPYLAIAYFESASSISGFIRGPNMRVC